MSLLWSVSDTLMLIIQCRLVWNRIWAVLSDFFVNVCCHQNLNIAIYAVDSLRQLAMKFLERDELANYSFQNDFMKPFVIVMRQSKAVEIRELIIRSAFSHSTISQQSSTYACQVVSWPEDLDVPDQYCGA